MNIVIICYSKKNIIYLHTLPSSDDVSNYYYENTNDDNDISNSLTHTSLLTVACLLVLLHKYFSYTIAMQEAVRVSLLPI